MKADLMLRNARIHTMSGDRLATSLAVWRGRIVAVDDEVAAARTIDLHGRTVIPGLNDAHNHMVFFGMSLIELDLSPMGSLDELSSVLREADANAAPGEWVIGSRYDQHRLGAHPTRQQLDAISRERPIYLKHTSGHMAVVNSAVLDMVDLDNVPAGGVVVRDADGEPTGLLQEQAQGLVQGLFRPYSQQAIVDALARASERYAAEGLTAVTECGIGGGWIGVSPAEFGAYQAARDAGVLRQRITVMPVSDALHPLQWAAADGDVHGLDLGLRTGLGDDLLRIGAVKVFSDGSLLGHTAAMCEDFSNSPGNSGFLQTEVEQLREVIIGAHRAGWQVATHAIGDRAVGTVLDIYEQALAEHPREDHRHRIEHRSVTRPEDLQRICRARPTGP